MAGARPVFRERLWRQLNHPFHRLGYNGYLDDFDVLDYPAREESVGGEIDDFRYGEPVTYRDRELEEWIGVLEVMAEEGEIYGQKYEPTFLSSGSYWYVDAVHEDELEVHFRYESV